MTITGTNKHFDVELNLVGSKSESNRVLMIGYYGDFEPQITNLSDSDDTKLLQSLLREIISIDRGQDTVLKKDVNGCYIVDCDNAGTVFRFLLSALALHSRESWILTGNERMKHRPVGELVDTLRAMGSDIEYMENEGFPPLKIGLSYPRCSTSQFSVDISRSSQFASSLLLAIPAIRRATFLRLTGDLSSLPYIDMTIANMCKFSAHAVRQGREIYVSDSGYINTEFTIESDWSAASYWYEIVAFSEGGRVKMKNLRLDSFQGDRATADIFESFGVQTTAENGCIVAVQKAKAKALHYDFSNTPDLFPAVAATCVGMQVEASFTGLRNLSIKESDRVKAMTDELSKIGVKYDRIGDDSLILHPLNSLPLFEKDNPIVFDTYGDHRIAMALAPLAMKIGAVEIKNPEVVFKSYPNYWNDLLKVFSL